MAPASLRDGQRKLFLYFGLLFLALIAQFRTSQSLRTGAPALACLSLRPFHGLHRAKPASASQFFVTQTSYTYAPGQNVTVDIMTNSADRYFRGFMIQAYDPITGTQIGHFLSSDDSRPIDSCSASTHRNNLNKHKVTLTWLPPAFTESVSSTANQWLGLGAPMQPMLRFNVNKRQLSPATPTADAPLQATATMASPHIEPVPGNHNETIATAHHQSGANRQVKFKATIVVTYEEFYTGFESSDQKFDKFDFAPKPAS